MIYSKNIIHPIGGINLTPNDVEKNLASLEGKILAVKLHPAFIIFMRQRFGYDVIRHAKNRNHLVMIDDKSYDIPVETASFVRMYEDSGADILTIHASAGRRALEEVMKAAVHIKIFGVTLLTSFPDWECKEIYVTEPKETVLRLMNLVEAVGLHGSVCAPRDLRWVAEDGVDLGARERLCPGIRDPREPVKDDDQNLARTLAPYEAKAAGVSIMVIGRPLKNAAKPGDVADMFQRQFEIGKAD